jgi:hypothetical protein
MPLPAMVWRLESAAHVLGGGAGACAWRGSFGGEGGRRWEGAPPIQGKWQACQERQLDRVQASVAIARAYGTICLKHV